MKSYFVIMIFTLVTLSFGQNKDLRAKFEISGWVNEISVSPDERIWLTVKFHKVVLVYLNSILC